jgi:hypothetical protein
LEAVHTALFLVQVDAEFLTEAAVRAESGELAGDALLSVLTDLVTYSGMVDQVAGAVAIPDDLASAWDEALQAHTETQSILGRWGDDEITPEELIREMEPVREMAAHAVETGEQAIAGVLGFDAAETEAAARPRCRRSSKWLSSRRRSYGVAKEAEGWAASQRGIALPTDGNPEIYVVNADGSGASRLTDSPGGTMPGVVAGRDRIAFSDREETREITS